MKRLAEYVVVVAAYFVLAIPAAVLVGRRLKRAAESCPIPETETP